MNANESSLVQKVNGRNIATALTDPRQNPRNQTLPRVVPQFEIYRSGNQAPSMAGWTHG